VGEGAGLEDTDGETAGVAASGVVATAEAAAAGAEGAASPEATGALFGAGLAVAELSSARAVSLPASTAPSISVMIFNFMFLLSFQFAKN